ncbi:hypothetical protein HY285_05545 [Candidatus Peregrinibacteria bacterium]|nr:hypothetical protein [Candidatus Peregrinibacteria bacterium]MBI3816972.1 hypothetical protein [Candidatus Peregrinibacteria bacterium]
MRITITLPPAIEDQLRVQAKATDKDINTFVVDAVEAWLLRRHQSHGHPQ